MTHMRWRKGYIWAREHGLHSVVWSLCVGGLKAWLIDGCSSKDAGKVERETPTPCGERNRRNQKNNTPVDPKPRTHTKEATTPISKCSQLSHTRNRTRNTPTFTAQCCQPHSLPNFLVPLCPPSRLCPLFFPRHEDPPQRLPTLFLLNSSARLSPWSVFSYSFPRCIFNGFRPRVFHAFSSSRLCFSLPQFPLSPSCFSLFFAERH